MKCPTRSGPYVCTVGDEGHPPPCECVQPATVWLGPADRRRQDKRMDSKERESTSATSIARATLSQDALSPSTSTVAPSSAEERLRAARERRERLLAEAAQLEADRRARQ